MPAYNEAAVIGETLSGLGRYFRNIVVVDDCSDDLTLQVARERGAHVCRHPVNLGQGAALQTGIDWALARGADVVVTFDADGQHSADDAARMCEMLESGGFDVVLGSRFLGEAPGISALRSLTLRLATLFTRLTTGMKLTDTHNGIRVFNASALRKFRIRENRMAHASEILQAISLHRMRYFEAPVTVVYTQYSRGKGQRLSGALEIIVDILVRGVAK